MIAQLKKQLNSIFFSHPTTFTCVTIRFFWFTASEKQFNNPNKSTPIATMWVCFGQSNWNIADDSKGTHLPGEAYVLSCFSRNQCKKHWDFVVFFPTKAIRYCGVGPLKSSRRHNGFFMRRRGRNRKHQKASKIIRKSIRNITLVIDLIIQTWGRSCRSGDRQNSNALFPIFQRMPVVKKNSPWFGWPCTL